MAKSNKRDLGKGIRALLSNIDEEIEENVESVVKELSHSIAMIPVASIEANPFQPRTEFNESALRELSSSITTYGLIQPITVRRLSADAYQIISGERRWRASKMAGILEVPAYIRIADDQGMLEMALVENIQRHDLNAIEVAISYQRLMDECELTHDLLAQRVGKERSTVTNYIRLLKLPPEIQSSLKSGQISMGHARVLAGMTNVDHQLDAFYKIIQSGLSVRATEQIAHTKQIIPNSFTDKESDVSPTMKKTQDELSAYFGTKVALKVSKNGAGKVEIFFSDNNELQTILDRLDV